MKLACQGSWRAVVFSIKEPIGRSGICDAVRKYPEKRVDLVGQEGSNSS